MNAFPDISYTVGEYSDVKHDKTNWQQYVAGVLSSHGSGACLINLAGIPLNPLSVSESWPGRICIGPMDMMYGVFGGDSLLLSEAMMV